MNHFLIAAGAATGLIWALHTFAGQVTVARPLLDAPDLAHTPKHTQFYCWHIVTLLLLALPAAFVFAALAPQHIALAWMATGIVTAMSVLGLVLPPLTGERYLDMPQGWLFLPVAVLGFAGLLT
ncbi:MAG: hypothetical protein AB8C46_13845 [Burkholderiaceae bacterium]